MSAPRWWSAGKRDWQELADMHGAYLLNCMAKLERGEYVLPDDDADPLATRPATSSERADLMEAFDAECQKRGIGRYEAPLDEGFA